MSRSFSIAILASLVVTGLADCTTAHTHDDAIRTVRIYDLLRALPRARLQVYPGYVANDVFSVNDEVRSGVFLAPAGSIVFPPVRVSLESVLTFKIGIIDDAWDKGGDGVEFTVSVQRMNDATTKIFSRYIDPKHNPDDRRWFDEKVPLRQFGDEEVSIMLATTPGPANDYSYDWAVFGEPQIVLGPAN